MNITKRELRKKLFFMENPADFSNTANAILRELKDYINSDPRTGYSYVEIMADLTIDLYSYLMNWKILPAIEEGILSSEEIENIRDLYIENILYFGGKKLLNRVNKEIQAVQKSQTKKISELYDAKKIKTVYGHDLAYRLDFGLRRGARWVTTNPAKITLLEKDYPHKYDEIMTAIKIENPNISVKDFTSMVFVKVVGELAKDLRPIYELTDGEWGFVCVQVSPLYIEDSQKMLEQAEYLWKCFQDELGVEDPNIVYKLPAVPASIETAHQMIELGFRLCLTLNFSVTQHEIFAEILQKGEKTGFVVFMGGYLDDSVKKELIEKGFDKERAEIVSRKASEAVMRKSYKNLLNKGFDKVSIMTAAVRGPWSMINSLSPSDGQTILITTTDSNINIFDQEERKFDSVIDVPVEEEIIEELSNSEVFLQAYASRESRVFNFENVLSYPPLVNVNDGFVNSYLQTMENAKNML